MHMGHLALYYSPLINTASAPPLSLRLAQRVESFPHRGFGAARVGALCRSAFHQPFPFIQFLVTRPFIYFRTLQHTFLLNSFLLLHAGIM
jgi:hypothetical protein